MIPVYKFLHDWPAVAGIVGVRIYRDWAGDTPTAPYVVWSVLAAPPDAHLSGAPPSDRYSVSVDVFATTEAQSDALVRACRDAMESMDGPRGTVSSGPQSLGREDATKLWRWTFTADVFRNR